MLYTSEVFLTRLHKTLNSDHYSDPLTYTSVYIILWSSIFLDLPINLSNPQQSALHHSYYRDANTRERVH